MSVTVVIETFEPRHNSCGFHDYGYRRIRYINENCIRRIPLYYTYFAKDDNYIRGSIF